jgi:GAF domain-containing protein
MNNPSILPATPKRSVELPVSYRELRSTLLKIFLWSTAIIGLYMIIADFSQMTLVIRAIIIAGYLFLLSAAIAPLPYIFRASALLVTIFLLSLFEFLLTGIFGNSRLFMLAFIFLAGLLFDRRGLLAALGISVLIIAIIGWLLMTGKVVLLSHEVTGGSLITWVVDTALLILVAFGLEESWRRLRNEFFVVHETLKNAMSTLNNERVNLENHIYERTKELIGKNEIQEKHANHWYAISEITHSIALIQEPDELFEKISLLVSEKFGFYHVGIYLNDDNGINTLLRAANSAGGQRMLARGYRVKIDQSNIVGYVAALGTPMIVGRVKDEVLYDNIPELPETQSMVTLPLKVDQRVIGVLDLESNLEEAVKEYDLEMLEMLANQIADAIEMTRTFSQTRRELSEARVVYGHYMRQAWEQIAGENRPIGYQYTASKVNPINTPLDLQKTQAENKSLSSSTPSGEVPSVTIPLKLREEIIGILDIRSNNPTRQWNENEMALIQAIAERVSLALENARLFEETTRRADREKTVSEITTHIRSTTDPQIMLQTALDELKRALGAKDIRIRPYSPPVDQNADDSGQPNNESDIKSS